MTTKIADRNIPSLETLTRKIKQNEALPEDYEAYVSFATNVGHDDLVESLKNKMRSAGYDDWKDYIRARKKAKTYDEKRKTEAIILGAILGLGLALVLSGKIDSIQNYPRTT